MIKIDKDREFPSDIVLLHAANSKDIVYVDTMNLDGETNLKEKYVLAKDQVPTLSSAADVAGEVVCDPPHESLDDWDANFHFKATGKVVNAK